MKSRAFAVALLCAALPMALGGCRGHRKAGPVAPIASSAPLPADDDTSAPTLAEIDLTKGVPEVSAAQLLQKPRATMYDLLGAMDEAVKDDDIQGFFVRLGTAPISFSQAPEIARQLKKARGAGKPVICHADNLTNASYWALADGCDEVWLSPPGGVDSHGIAAQLIFAQPLLAKLGIQIDVLQVGKYKGTGEMFTRASASDEEKQSLGGTLGDMRAVWLASVAAARKRTDGGAVLEQGPFVAEDAKSRGLIDQIGYLDDARMAARRRIGAGQVDVIYSPTMHHADDTGFVDLVRAISGAKRKGGGGAPYIAVVRTSGAIAMEKGGGLPGSGDSGIFARTLEKTLHRLSEDDSAKAVVIRIDSPGGSALASDLMWHDLMNVRKKKPLIISVGDMAASGGYYMAAAGTKIVAEETSIVGSIGVVGGKLAIGPALAQLGINTQVVGADGTTDVNRAAMDSLFEPWDDPSRAKMLATMESLYRLFIDRIAEGRGLPREKVEGFAEGRIFSGRDGKARGMVDEIGGYERAIELARSEAKIGSEVRVRLVGDAPSSLLDMFNLDDEDAHAAAQSSVKAVVPTSAFAIPEDLMPQAEALLPIATGERALATIPFALVLR